MTKFTYCKEFYSLHSATRFNFRILTIDEPVKKAYKFQTQKVFSCKCSRKIFVPRKGKLVEERVCTGDLKVY